jgi:hypothetical protein
VDAARALPLQASSKSLNTKLEIGMLRSRLDTLRACDTAGGRAIGEQG